MCGTIVQTEANGEMLFISIFLHSLGIGSLDKLLHFKNVAFWALI